jgi:DNA invertase Pin-like site-specific DNA recombinase
MARRTAITEQEASVGRTVYGYTRGCTEGQATEGQSLEVQRHRLEGWAMQRGSEFSEVVVDPGVSGGIPFAERPEGGKLWPRLQKGDVLVASKLDTLFRSAADCLQVVEELKTRGVSLFLLDLNDGADDVSGNGIARLFLTIVSSFAEFERDRIGEAMRLTTLIVAVQVSA